MWEHVKQTLVAGFIFKRHLAESYERGIGFNGIAVQSIHIRSLMIEMLFSWAGAMMLGNTIETVLSQPIKPEPTSTSFYMPRNNPPEALDEAQIIRSQFGCSSPDRTNLYQFVVSKILEDHYKGKPYILLIPCDFCEILRVSFNWIVINHKMELQQKFSFLRKGLSRSWVKFFRVLFMKTSEDLPEIILILSLICAIGAFLNLHLKDFLIPLPVILFLIGCSFEMLSFTSDQVQRYANAIQSMSPDLFFDIFTPIIIFNVAFDMDIYMLQKLFWQLLLISIPGFLMNYLFILWYLSSVDKLLLHTTPRLLFSTILLSSDPMMTAAAIRDLGLSRSLVDLISGECLITSVLSLVLYTSIVEITNTLNIHVNNSIAYQVMESAWSNFIASTLFGMIGSNLIQWWMATVFVDDVYHINLTSAALYLIYYISELVGMSGIFTLAIMGLLLNSTSLKPGVEAILLELLVFLLMSPLLSRLGHGFSWRWAFIMVWSEMKGIPNINMALLFAYSDVSFGSEREKSQILFHGVSVCLINLIINRFILPMAVDKLGLHDDTSTKYKSLNHTFQHFQELTKSTASALKFDKDLANADWNTVEQAIILQNPYALSQEAITGHPKVKCPDCNKEIDHTHYTEATELTNRRLLRAQIASYQRQYKNETLSQDAVQMLVGAAKSFGERTGKYLSPDTIKDYSEGNQFLSFSRKLLLNWVYNTKKEKGVPSRYYILRLSHSIVFTDEFEYVGYLVILMNLFPITITWVSKLNDVYENELIYSNYVFLSFYILESLIKIAAMRKEYFLHAWNLFELVITIIGIIDVILLEATFFHSTFDYNQAAIFMKIVQIFRVLRILKLVTPKFLQLIDKKMSHQLSLRYAILKGYVQGEADIMTIIDKIESSKQVKQMLLRRVKRNTGQAMKELGYLEYDHPEIAITMKTKEQIHLMLNLASQIVEVFRVKGILHKVEGAEINKLIMIKKREILNDQLTIKPLTADEVLYHIPWLDKDKELINFIREEAKIITFDCGNDIFEEGDEPQGIYVIISGMVKFQSSKPGVGMNQILEESEEKDNQITYIDFMISGEIIGELNCLTKEPMKYSATCKTVVETFFIPKNHLYKAFDQYCPHMEYKMWLKLGLSITARKIKEHLSYEEWNYKLQLKLCNVFVKDIPKSTKTDIYGETVAYVILIHGAVEDCQLRKAYKAPSLIPTTCCQVQGTEDFTKVMIVETRVDLQNHRRSTRKFVSSHKPASVSEDQILEEDPKKETNMEDAILHSNSQVPILPESRKFISS
ncbi:PREDICTED: sodium/hydrogen exchanger 10 [Condylura cristata]|uniref:sodium/hydrogen exchanger 10 n=1 Tax=Condylura cristata TaxID=143302 RepID=UPI000643797D|nr:PREDICTED: sodium/hydrogen exchanger 10 [Condylura cristata]